MPNTGLLNTTDYALIIIYLLGVVAFGSFMARGQKTSEDYFVAGRQMHWFPVALSLWASLTSANSMLGAPSYGYSQDLQQIPLVLASIVGAVFAAHLVLPLLYPLALTTSYTYLEKRFNLLVRCLGSALFILLRGGWLASVIFVPSLALSAVIPIPRVDEALQPLAQWCGISGSTIFWILVVGVGATIYTTLGGLKAVIWTDVVQFFVFVVGIAAIWFLLLKEIGGSNMFEQLGKVPRAYAGIDSDVGWGETVHLDGTRSKSFDGTPLVYQWSQLDANAENRIDLLGADTATPSFVAPDRAIDDPSGHLRFALRVTTTADPPLQSPPHVITVTVTTTPQPNGEPTGPDERPHDTWFDFSFSHIWTTGAVTFWMLLATHILARINDAGTDQIALQRYFSTSSMGAGKRAIWVNAICDLPMMTFLALTGAGVLVYYAIHHHPDVPIRPGQAMPYFVAHNLNKVIPGLAGLFIAALFAATMSSIDSGINSIGAAISTDWYRRLIAPGRDEAHHLLVARIITLVLGVLATGVAMFLGRIGELWEIGVTLMGFWTGPLLCIFLLGFFTRRANAPGVLVGAAAGMVCTCTFFLAGGNAFLYGAVGLIPALVVGYFVSVVTKKPTAEQTDGLTCWTR